MKHFQQMTHRLLTTAAILGTAAGLGLATTGTAQALPNDGPCPSLIGQEQGALETLAYDYGIYSWDYDNLGAADANTIDARGNWREAVGYYTASYKAVRSAGCS